MKCFACIFAYSPKSKLFHFSNKFKDGPRLVAKIIIKTFDDLSVSCDRTQINCKRNSII